MLKSRDENGAHGALCSVQSGLQAEPAHLMKGAETSLARRFIRARILLLASGAGLGAGLALTRTFRAHNHLQRMNVTAHLQKGTWKLREAV